ncbi:peptidoglycan DD-metalloendopeptidase family protein [Virgibacillus sp. W0181]|uniref:peptidoglycan DD-metalloendopeptidase family protein n=1 Tax=Virgibacillus sp. W0181 TaxID=3391581 RepID=UPI003F481311
MDRGVKKVREKIKHRKKLRHLPADSKTRKQIYPAILQDEEKHGYYPNAIEQDLHRNDSKLFSGLLIKGVFSIALFIGTAWILESKTDYLDQPKQWTQYAFTEEFPFAKVNQWYNTTFGSPLSFTPTEKEEILTSDQVAMPVNGRLEQTFQTNGTGIMISPEETTQVSSIREGVVIFAGNDREKGKTIVVQHPDNSQSTYGSLSSIYVYLYQFIDKDQAIGAFQPTEENKAVYFSIEKDSEYIDPIQVIPVDDSQ